MAIVPFGPWTPVFPEPFVSSLQSVKRYVPGSDTSTQLLQGQIATIKDSSGTRHILYTGGDPFEVQHNPQYHKSGMGQAYRAGGVPDGPQYWNMDVPPVAVGWVIEARGEVSPPWLEYDFCEANNAIPEYDAWADGLGEDRYWAWRATHWTDASDLYANYVHYADHEYPADKYRGWMGPLGASDVHLQTYYSIWPTGNWTEQANPILVLNTPDISVSTQSFVSPMTQYQRTPMSLAGVSPFTIPGWGPALAVGFTIERYPVMAGDGTNVYYRGIGEGKGTIVPNSFRWLTNGIAPYLGGAPDKRLTRLA